MIHINFVFLMKFDCSLVILWEVKWSQSAYWINWITVLPTLLPSALFQFESVFMICFIVSGLECLYVMWPLDDGGSHKTNVSLTRTRKSHHTFIILNCFISDFRHNIIIFYQKNKKIFSFSISLFVKTVLLTCS